MSDDKLYSVEEANALLPYLSPTLVELRERWEEAAEAREAISTSATGNGWSTKREKWASTLARVGELIDRLNDWAIQVRDINTGLIDFPAERDGEPIWLCWRLGEPDVAYWHSRDEGFAGRQPL